LAQLPTEGDTHGATHADASVRSRENAADRANYVQKRIRKNTPQDTIHPYLLLSHLKFIYGVKFEKVKTNPKKSAQSAKFNLSKPTTPPFSYL
jgi:hypothetical protein